VIFRAIAKLFSDMVESDVEREFKRIEHRAKIDLIIENTRELHAAEAFLVNYFNQFRIDWSRRLIEMSEEQYKTYRDLYRDYFVAHCTLHGLKTPPHILRLSRTPKL
jgi:hypothetical protein